MSSPEPPLIGEGLLLLGGERSQETLRAYGLDCFFDN